MKSIILYGCNQNLNEKFNDWHQNGLVPVCIADSQIANQHTIYSTPFGDFEVLSLLEAINKYPDYQIYCTHEKSSLATVTEFLCAIGIPYERIMYCEGFIESASCDFLDSYAMLIEFTVSNGQTNFTFCLANSANKIVFPATGDFLRDYQTLCNYNENLKKMLRVGYHTGCDNCSHRCTKVTTEKIKNKLFIIGTGIVGLDSCNLNCSFCFCPPNKYGRCNPSSKVGDKYDSKYDGLELIKTIENEFDPQEVNIIFAGGEIGVSVYKNEILSIWDKNKWRGELHSNATIFVPGVALLLEQKLVTLVTSLDSGTAATYTKIKGVDLFEKALNNLEKYARTNGKIQIKYIFLEGINDSIEELDAFFDVISSLCRKYPQISLLYSRDYQVNHVGISPNEIKACKYFRKKCDESNITCDFFLRTFSQDDIKAVLE